MTWVTGGGNMSADAMGKEEMAPLSTTYYGTTYYGACVDYFSRQAEERDVISRHLALPAAQMCGVFTV